jgi:methyl-accepting chemotaxis protein
MNTTTTNSIKETQTISKFFKDIYKKSDKLIGYFLLSYFVFGLLLAFWYDTWIIAIGVGGLCTACFFLATKLFPDSTINQYVASAAVGIYVAQYIYQMHGMFEMHFFAFIGATLMISYQNWKSLIPVGLIVAVHHGLFAYLEYIGNDKIYFTTDQYDMGLQAFIFHVVLAVIILFICGLWSYQLEQNTINNTKNILIVEELSNTMMKNMEFANELANGKTTTAYTPDADDVLGEALLKIKEKLNR